MFSILNNKYKISIFIFTFLFMVSLIPSQITAATPLSSKQEEVKTITAQVDELDEKVEIITEQYNDAQINIKNLNNQIDKTRAEIIEQSKLIEQLENSLSMRAQSLYRDGHFSYVELLLSAKTFKEFFTIWDLVEMINMKDVESINNLEHAREKAWVQEEQLILQKAKAREIADDIAAKAKVIESQLLAREALLEEAQEEVANLQEVIFIHYNPPTTNAKGGIVNIAKQYLGAPYRWGASGPNSFDCSGFTMYIYQKIGISLPHSSRAQSFVGKKIKKDQLQPGDLVFFGSPIHHVGLYVGNGMMIHAPHTGATVRYDPINRSNYAGAVRL